MRQHKQALERYLKRFYEHGGTLETAKAIAEHVHKSFRAGAKQGVPQRLNGTCPSSDPKSGAGQLDVADKATNRMPSPDPVSEAGHSKVADKAVQSVPVSRPDRSEGYTMCADKAVQILPSSATPKPGHAKRGAASIASIQGVLAKSLFQTTKLPDGRSLAEIRWQDCPGLAKRYRRCSRILMAAYQSGRPDNPAATLPNVINEERLSEILKQVEMVNDIA